jgi:hypothetical protein
VRIFRELARESPQDINYQGYLGALAVRLGDRASAERIAEALRLFDGRYRFGRRTYCRARIASLLGEKEKAVDLLRAAFTQGYRFTITVHRDPDFEPLRNYPLYQDLIRPNKAVAKPWTPIKDSGCPLFHLKDSGCPLFHQR